MTSMQYSALWVREDLHNDLEYLVPSTVPADQARLVHHPVKSNKIWGAVDQARMRYREVDVQKHTHGQFLYFLARDNQTIIKASHANTVPHLGHFVQLLSEDADKLLGVAKEIGLPCSILEKVVVNGTRK